jgi:hypothetical protein
MHGGTTLGGPVWLFLVTVLLLAVGGAVFVVVDSLRPRRAPRFDNVWESNWFYMIPQAVYLGLVATAQLAPIGPIAVAVTLATPLALVQQFAYLLRIVYPKPETNAGFEPEPSREPPDERDPGAPPSAGA